MIRLGFDIGGTFTDCIIHDTENGWVGSVKTSTTINNPAIAVMEGLQHLLAENNITANQIKGVLHATTVATNAVIERKGSNTALITTKGFRDTLIIGRQKRYETYDLYAQKPEPLVRRRNILEVLERVDSEGQVIVPMDPTSVDVVIKSALELGTQSIAISLIHAYANPKHEKEIAEQLVKIDPNIYVSCSSQVAPKYREYERTNTTVLNAYVRPIVSKYLAELKRTLEETGIKPEVFVMQSNGGLVSPELAATYPVRILESGPAAGVLMANEIGKSLGNRNVITFDMGGTTAKLGAIDDGNPSISPSFEVDPIQSRKGSGLPVTIPSIELLEIGAGGGSIAGVQMGMIKVGPESAGATPGPLCYDKGGKYPTITDANLILGYIDPKGFNNGTIKLNADKARIGIKRVIAEPLNLSIGEAAWGIHLIATSNMEHAIRLVSVERGRNPREYALVAFGGSGPLHATRLARAIGVPRVIIPAGAGVGSAVGLLRARPRIEVGVTRVLPMSKSTVPQITEVYRDLTKRIKREIDLIGDWKKASWSRYAYMRYAGQGFEIRVNLPDGAIDDSYPGKATEAFHRSYRQKHNYQDKTALVEAVDWNLVATLKNETTDQWRFTISTNSRKTQRQAWFPEAGGYVDTTVINRAALAQNGEKGPLIIEDPDCTTLLLKGDKASLDPTGHIIIEIAEDKKSAKI